MDFFDDGQNWDGLDQFLKLDLWEEEVGKWVLLGFHPFDSRGDIQSRIAGLAEYGIVTLQGKSFSDSILNNFTSLGLRTVKESFESKKSYIDTLWDSTEFPSPSKVVEAENKSIKKFYPIGVFIAWAIEKNIEIPWLIWAKSQSKLPESRDKNFEYNDIKSAELLLAIDAYKHFFTNPSSEVKNQEIGLWLHDQSISRGITHKDSGKTLNGLSQKKSEAITGIIKP